MNNIIVIAFNGKKPSKREIEALGNGLMSRPWCEEVEIVKHYDNDSITDIVGKGTILIGFEKTADNEALKNAAAFINAHFSSNSWGLFEAAANAKNTIMRSEDQEALLNAVDIIANSSQENCALYGISEHTHMMCYNVKQYVLE